MLLFVRVARDGFPRSLAPRNLAQAQSFMFLARADNERAAIVYAGRVIASHEPKKEGAKGS